MQSGGRSTRRRLRGSRRADVSVKGAADISGSGIGAPSGSRREWMVMGRPESWSRTTAFWKLRALDGAAMRVALAPWEAKTLAMSIIGIWWPPPTNGKKYISIGASEAMGVKSFSV
ncbi:hypothetical protein TorRG33x02_221430 [Trema orientale]|uniref:Uncharacterized protein n=1 Tax=Trema orientale TaxID=63057 RepID=A0A2P5E917_TREOI|nr:hypothetical protein TorRG33x02_221430 [Trema orientale]